MTRAQRDALSNLDAANLCDSFVVSPPHFGTVLAELRERTLFSEECMSHWAGARLLYLWCDCTTWSIVMGKWKLEEEIQARQGRSYAPPVEFRRMDGCNHFVRRASCPHRRLADDAFAGGLGRPGEDDAVAPRASRTQMRTPGPVPFRDTSVSFGAMDIAEAFSSRAYSLQGLLISGLISNLCNARAGDDRILHTMSKHS